MANLELGRVYVHRIDHAITAVPFNLIDDQVEITLNTNGILQTGAMSLEDFTEQFEIKSND